MLRYYAQHQTKKRFNSILVAVISRFNGVKINQNKPPHPRNDSDEVRRGRG